MTHSVEVTGPRWAFTDGDYVLIHSTILGGVGLSSVGVDRGAVGPSLLCRIDAAGTSAAVTAVSTAFGSMDLDGPGPRAARDSFAEAVISHCATDGGECDLSAVATFDFLNVARMLSNAKGQVFHIDDGRSRVTRVVRYPDCLRIDAVLTFCPRDTVPEPAAQTGHSPVARRPTPLGFPAPLDAVSIRQQVVIRRLPEPGYRPVPFDPTVGETSHFATHDFDRLLERDSFVPLASRFRLDPGGGREIVFYLDPAIPNPLRDAIREGAGWWRAAFLRAGFGPCFRVADLPDDVDIEDPRINLVLWVHRGDRGWSFGSTQIDPRTGEILRGLVVLGSQRVEEVRAIAEGVLCPYATDRVEDVFDVVLARMRQLAVHEVGHALGLAHNFASHLHSELSVMDYPGPRFVVDEAGRIDHTRAYSSGLGPWDFRQIAALYTDGWREERPGEAGGDDTLYITDADSRVDDAANGESGTWITRGQPFDEMRRVLAVRSRALELFSEGVAAPGSDSGEIVRRFMLVYLMHRYQVIALAKVIGGSRRRYARVEREGFAGRESVLDPAMQRQALHDLGPLFEPAFLRVPPRLVNLLVAPSGGLDRRSDDFFSRTRGTFDIVSAMAAGADLVAAQVLAPTRLNRVHAQSSAAQGIDLSEVVKATVGFATERLVDDARDPGDEIVGWTLLRRFGTTLGSAELHEHVRIALVEQSQDLISDRRPVVAQRLRALLDDASKRADTLPVIPLGAPI